jgi:ketosteroid isomerase-like protein
VYKATVRWMIKRNIDRMNGGDHEPALAMFAEDATLSFPGDNSWSNMERPVVLGRAAFVTHRGKAEIRRFVERYAEQGFHMVVDDILVNGGPWRCRAAVRVHHWATGPDGTDVYTNRAVLFVETRWGRIVAQEDYEDTERVAAYDRWLATSGGAGPRR